MTIKLNRFRSVAAICAVLCLLCCGTGFADTLYAFNPAVPSQPWTLALDCIRNPSTNVYTYSLTNPERNSGYRYANYITDFQLTIQGLEVSDINTTNSAPANWTVNAYSLGDSVRIQWTGGVNAGLAPKSSLNFSFVSSLSPSFNTTAIASSFGGDTYGPTRSQVTAVPEFSSMFSAVGILGGVVGPLVLRRRKK